MKKKCSCALTIAGSDSGGGAGIQADLKTFASLGVHGASAITCITAQTPRGVRAIQSCKPAIVLGQLEEVFEELRPAAVKTGMLFSTEIIRVVVAFFERGHRPPLIVDPVMVATSGARLLKPSAVRILQRELLPLATLATPNVDEAEILTGRKIKSVEDLRAAAKGIKKRYGCAALVKGGHLGGVREAVDIYYDGKQELLLTSTFIRGLHLHGTGCTYSAAIAGYLALGCELSESVRRAKQYITQAIAQSVTVAGHTALNSFWKGNAR
ncbi:MAG: bifunctional hydroxymethylpyrimidine kinase/phosphomethylpyrimidine kinase [Verrucomicrobia bacterium]|nr:bifunctional hydroxymethylpyrimidine kinase/phosphomethylpyrimidine kinase [Verrucomicrobiota bacterium]